MSQPDKVKEGAEGGQVSEAGGRQQGSKGQELWPGYKGPQRNGKWVHLALCTKRGHQSFLQKERGVI